MLFRLKKRVLRKIKNWYVSNFQMCKKCGKKIKPKSGFWHYKNKYPLIGGYYHTECGTINNPTKTGLPF